MMTIGHLSVKAQGRQDSGPKYPALLQVEASFSQRSSGLQLTISSLHWGISTVPPPTARARSRGCSMAKPPKVSGTKTGIWRKGSKVGFLLRTVSSTVNGKAFSKWFVEACSSGYGLDQLQWGASGGPFPQHGAGEGGSYILIIAEENPLFSHG